MCNLRLSVGALIRVPLSLSWALLSFASVHTYQCSLPQMCFFSLFKFNFFCFEVVLGRFILSRSSFSLSHSRSHSLMGINGSFSIAMPKGLFSRSGMRALNIDDAVVTEITDAIMLDSITPHLFARGSSFLSFCLFTCFHEETFKGFSFSAIDYSLIPMAQIVPSCLIPSL